MKLSQEDADLFFELMWALQWYVNRERGVIPDCQTLDDYLRLSTHEKIEVRDALFDHPELIDAFVGENPTGLTKERLGLISKWKHFVRGDFYIERLLKKHAVFVSADDDRVFGVHALHDSFEDIFYARGLPVIVRAVLLPFKGVIVYDGVFQGYNVFFGSGIKASLKEAYLAAKQHRRLVLSLDPEARAARKSARQRKKPARDWRPELDDLIEQAGKLRGGAGQHALMTPAFRLVRLSLELARQAAGNPDDLEPLWKKREKIERALGRVEDILHRAEMYR